MSSLLFEAKLNKLRAFTIFGQTIGIYEDYVTFTKRFWFNVDEVTMTANNIAQVNLSKGIFFSTIQIINTSGSEDVKIKHVWNPVAVKAKAILDQKLHQLHNSGMNKDEFERPVTGELENFERSLNRMKELVQQGKMTEKEYEQKRLLMLKRVE